MTFCAWVFALSLILTSFLSADLPNMPDLLSKSLNIKLEAPIYKDGVTTTDQGGVVTGKDLFLQAQKMKYIHRQEAGQMVRRIEAEGELFFRFKNRIYTGDKLEFDMDKQTAVIYNVRTDAGPWFLGGSKLLLNQDGSSIIDDCRMTTDENMDDDWTILAKEVHLSKNNTLKADNVQFTVFQKPIFWIPSLSKDLNNDSFSPIRYRVGYYGHRNLRLGLSYDFDTGENWKNRVLMDISTRRGLAGGFETKYKNPDKKEVFESFNYYAHDIATNDSDRLHRYRFQGKYTNKFFDDKVGFRAQYDKLSDPEFPADFTSRGLDSSKANPTEAQFTRKDPNWISSLNTKVRVNSFQTVKQQLPLFTFNMRPVTLGSSQIVLDNRFNAGYLNYLYAHKTPDVHNFHSSRVDLGQKLYRPCPVGIFSITPHAGYRAIGYGNSPQHEARFLAQGIVGVEAHTRFKRVTDTLVHAVEPYAQYDY
ncbi:MAG: LPS assembly protein LptD [Chlamydiales bacterium]|nr:LPS assembly protein LptD [Chlamydiales bacterium]